MDAERVLGADGPGEMVLLDGVEWWVSVDTERDRLEFVKWLEGSVLSEAYAREDDMPPERFAAYHAETVRQINSKMYKWGKAGCREALATREGASRFLVTLLRRRHKDVTLEQAAALFDGQTRRVVEILMKYLKRGPAPKSEAQAAASR